MAETAKSISTEEAKGIAIDELLKRLSADKNGLSTSVAKDRHQKFLYGYNEITKKKEVRCSNFGIIFALLLFIAVAGFWQEKKADNAIEL
ncbi:hypothetical protein C4E24_08385 [ANME-1 cluster archaeon AG-394-G21]|nr:hypothetical protein [ANME-1 cluster archaeon AG-394-G21]